MRWVLPAANFSRRSALRILPGPQTRKGTTTAGAISNCTRGTWRGLASFSSPASALQEKLAKPRHVPRVQLEIAPAVVVPFRVCGPGNILNAERREKFAAGKTQRIRAGEARQKSGDD